MTKNQDGRQWSEDLVRRVGLAMKKARGAKSAKWLSDETAALGYRVSPTVIAKLDSGHRGSVLSVAELLVMAVALDIPPALLLFPTYPDGKVELVPGRQVDASRCVDWLSGHSTLEIGPSNAGTELVEAVGRLASIDDGLFRLQGEMEELTMNPAVAVSTKEVIRRMEEQSAAVKNWINKAKAALWGAPSEEPR